MNSSTPFGGIFSGKRVLVTGHTGFKGSWLSIWLRTLGADVYGYSLEPPTKPSNFKLCHLDDRINSFIGDIRNLHELAQVFQKSQPEIIFHLAAQPLVRESYRAPKDTMDTNIGGTVNLLECVRLHTSVRSLVVITSDKCYKNNEWDYGYRENDPMGGNDPYSASKGCAELVTQAYRRSYFSHSSKTPGARPIGVATTRGGNVIGGGDWAEDRLVPDCVRAFSTNKPLELRYPNATRPWQHVLEPLAGYLQLAAALLDDPPQFSSAWNFGPAEGKIVTTHQLAQNFLRVWGEGTIKLLDHKDTPHEAQLLRLSCAKAFSKLLWHPVLSLTETIDWTAQWYSHWYRHQGEDLYPLCEKQIHEYFLRAQRAKLAWAAKTH
ncbi:MAG: CDP-glucose 4,6-dehydratase [Pseudomonadota bacterium]